MQLSCSTVVIMFLSIEVYFSQELVTMHGSDASSDQLQGDMQCLTQSSSNQLINNTIISGYYINSIMSGYTINYALMHIHIIVFTP